MSVVQYIMSMCAYLHITYWTAHSSSFNPCPFHLQLHIRNNFTDTSLHVWINQVNTDILILVMSMIHNAKHTRNQSRTTYNRLPTVAKLRSVSCTAPPVRRWRLSCIRAAENWSVCQTPTEPLNGISRYRNSITAWSSVGSRWGTAMSSLSASTRR